VSEQKILTIREAAKEYGFPEYGLRGLVKTGKFPVIKCGNRHYITRTAFEDYLKTGGEKYEPKHEYNAVLRKR